MKLKLCIALCFVSIAQLIAQNTGKLSGKIVDAQTNETIPYATLIVKNNGIDVVTDVTDLEGNFNLNSIPLQANEFIVQFIGYATYSQTISFKDKNTIVLGSIKLKSQETKLDELKIVAERSSTEQKIDRKVINVGRDLTTVGATASEIMNNIPSVSVDQDGNLSLRGNSNVRVLIDGRPTNMDVATLLKQIPSTSIKSIELITNPSAKYNPEGMSGIINIVLHKNTMDGFNGSFSTGITFAKTPKYNNSFNANFRKGKFNLFATLGNNIGDNRNGGHIEIEKDQSTQLLKIKSTNRNEFFKIGTDIYLNDKNTLSVYTNQSFGNSKFAIDNYILFPNATNNFFQNDSYRGNSRNSIYNLAYKKLFEKQGETLDFEATYNNATGEQNSKYFPNAQDLGLKDFSNAKDNSAVINLDYVNPLSEKSKLELGAEARITRTDNEFTTNRQGQENAGFTYDFDIYSAYATFGQKFTKFSYQLGARVESYNVRANYTTTTQNGQFKNDYITVYPSAYLNYALNEKNNFNLSVSRRVDRPSVNQTKPIRTFSSARVSGMGNPELTPQFTNSIELGYTKNINKSSISATIFYRDINDQISQVFLNDDTAEPNDIKLIQTFANFDHNTSAGFEVSANLKLNSWWDMQPSVDYANVNQNGMVAMFNDLNNTYELKDRKVSTTTFNSRINNNFKITNQFRMSLFGFYRAPYEDIQNHVKEMYKIDLGARYSFWENKANVNLRFNDIFKTMKYGYTSTHPYPGKGEFTWESQSLYVGFNYMFGGGKNRALQRKNRDNNESKSSGGIF